VALGQVFSEDLVSPANPHSICFSTIIFTISYLPSAISSLEAGNSNTSLYQSLSVFETTVSKFNSISGRVGKVVKEKVHSIL
jgi:hypothetical protein